MRVLTDAEFVTMWEAGDRLHPLDRGLLAIRASLSKAAAEPVADWPLGRRNRALAMVHTLYFGPTLEGWTTCRQCSETLEFALACDELAEAPDGAIEDAMSDEPVSLDGFSFRLPTSRDLARIALEDDPDRAVVRLLALCCTQDDSADLVEDSASVLPAWLAAHVDEIASRMALADPLAEIALALECPMCGHRSEETLDLPTFLWSEIASRARRVLLDVHAIACVYGWSESAILAMSDVRRAAYVEMVQA